MMGIIEDALEKLRSDAMIESLKTNFRFWITWAVICAACFLAFGLWVKKEHIALEDSISRRAEERKAETAQNLKLLQEIQDFQYRMDTSQKLLLENREIWSAYVKDIKGKIETMDKKIEENTVKGK
jgi:hypothetical protein